MIFDDIVNRIKDAHGRVVDSQKENSQRLHHGSSGAGAVKITLNGIGEMMDLEIDTKNIACYIGDENSKKKTMEIERLVVFSDLIKAAYNDARGKINTDSADVLKELMQSMSLFNNRKDV